MTCKVQYRLASSGLHTVELQGLSMSRRSPIGNRTPATGAAPSQVSRARTDRKLDQDLFPEDKGIRACLILGCDYRPQSGVHVMWFQSVISEL